MLVGKNYYPALTEKICFLISNFQFPISNKCQMSKSQCLEFGHFNLFGILCLQFGISLEIRY
ncbi:hypothetical protein AUJ78_00315 [Candidatus Peregrinibacteria bacterium CG1_02_41_10]|nr:MAG: hypothetical protein AUJ78_00315 [Candidatus Peregrinibacteria bacterium CG1_02_41_10]